MRLGSLYETCCCNGGDDKCPTCGIPNYGQDHNYADAIEQGEDPATHTRNIPALTAAKMSNGTPHPWVVNNGINGRGAGFDWDPNKDKGFKTLYGEREDDAFSKEMQESVDVCDVLSSISLEKLHEVVNHNTKMKRREAMANEVEKRLNQNSEVNKMAADSIKNNINHPLSKSLEISPKAGSMLRKIMNASGNNAMKLNKKRILQQNPKMDITNTVHNTTNKLMMEKYNEFNK